MFSFLLIVKNNNKKLLEKTYTYTATTGIFATQLFASINIRKMGSSAIKVKSSAIKTKDIMLIIIYTTTIINKRVTLTTDTLCFQAPHEVTTVMTPVRSIV